MEYRRLGNTGMQVSAISLGAWLTFGSESMDFTISQAIVRTAIENGINFIDTANVYAHGEAEKAVGKIIKDYDRNKLVISTKAFGAMSDDPNDQGLSRKHLVQSVEASLRRLETDYIDIFYCHRYDHNTATEETVRAIEDLIRQGKIVYWGTSMWSADQIAEAVNAADQYNAYRPVVEQPLYNMLDRHAVEGGLETALDRYSIGLTVYSPLAGGLLTGKYNEGVPANTRAARINDDWMQERFADHRITQARQITDLAASMEVKPAALALAWALKHPNVDSVITGATRPEHVLSNLEALAVELSPEVEQRIENILQNKPETSQRVIVDPENIPAL